MVAESVVYALAFGMVTSTLTGLLLPALAIIGRTASLAVGSVGSWSLPTQLMISLGAGIYEELLFRVILVSGLAWIARRVLGWRTATAGLFAVAAGALIFSAFHYIGPYGDRFQLGSFTFRAVAGVLFSGLYLLRGFGITAWTHALYDVFLRGSAVGGVRTANGKLVALIPSDAYRCEADVLRLIPSYLRPSFVRVLPVFPA